jgi:thymidylate synthase (FAD)
MALSEHYGFVRLDGYCADDLSVVNAARVSFGRRTETMTEPDKALIGFLMRERHGSPFEHNMFRFHVKAPIFVTREWFRHRIGWSYNEYSGRYAEIQNDHYHPSSEDFRTQVGKPGSYSFNPMNEDADAVQKMADAMSDSMENSYRTYQSLLKQGVAKELARIVLPVGTFTEFYATCNARSLMHFLSLRSSPNAQKEIRMFAEELENHFAKLMPATREHFIQNGRIAP